MSRRSDRIQRALDGWFGTLTRYAGLLMLFYAVTVDKGRNPALFPGAVTLIFFKNVAGSGRNGNGRNGRNHNP